MMRPGSTVPWACLVLACVVFAGFVSCSDIGSCREVGPGDMVITEVFANPKGEDADGVEWFELYAVRDLDPSFLKIESGRPDGSGREAFFLGDASRVGAGSYLVLGDVRPDGTEGIEYVDVGYGSSLGSLRNTGGMLVLWCGDMLVDRVVYGPTDDGVSTALDGGSAPSADGNDETTAWCPSVSMFGQDAYGTPGEPNDTCLVPGDLSVSEIMANPDGPDSGHEWIELYAGKGMNLKGLSIVTARPDGTGAKEVTLPDFPVVEGAFVVVGDAAAGEEPAFVDLPLGSSLGDLRNDGGIVSLYQGTRVIDDAAYPKASSGVSWSMDRADGSWCLSPGGTPGFPNPRCNGTVQ